ncbi:HEAT repeat domain-containing protein [uncultured Tenacibaculum sp.]|uniref:HEAT repeat domain-containing protein n=1 Tax=uncultured Tenacibaculum sp. TaxID=174713 RepID=UPI00263540D0|nr:HEAT repeat domain-containing protein [uncultured Tenacibaculum sp.]
MKCKEIQDKLMAYVMHEVSDTERNLIEEHIESCDACQLELKNTQLLIEALGEVKEEQPGITIKHRFETALQEEIKLEKSKVVRLETKQEWKSYLRVAASVVILISGYFLGKMSNNEPEINSNKEQQALFVLLENQSASKRILAISKTTTYSVDDTRIIDALINKMFVDKNINVRLAAVEALTKFSSLEKVRNALLKALETDTEPSVQIELIQVLAEIQEKRALIPMKKLLDHEETPDYVKQELAYNMPTLI